MREVAFDASLRLRPEMTSRRNLVLAFVSDYIQRWQNSPSYGEIANGLNISPTRARQLVQALVKSGQLLRKPGPRGISLPAVRDEAVRQLRELGWQVDEDLGQANAPCALSPLPARVVLDYLPDKQSEFEGQWEQRRAGASGSA